jgi:hypothetical protein
MNLRSKHRKQDHRMTIVWLKQLFFVTLFLFLMPSAIAADNITALDAGNYSDVAGISFQQYIIDLDMSFADEILAQETWTLSGEGITTIGLSVPQDAVIMRFQKQDMSNTTSAVDLEYNRTGDIFSFSDNISSVSSESPQLYSLVYVLPEKSNEQFTKVLTVPGYQPSSIHSLVLNVKTNQNVDPVVFDENGISLSSNSQKEGNITTFSFSHPSFNDISVSTKEQRGSNNFMYFSALFFIAGLLALGGAIYVNKKNKDTHKNVDNRELEYRYAAIQKVLSTIDSDLKEKIIDEDIHSAMSTKYKKEASAIRKETDKMKKR